MNKWQLICPLSMLFLIGLMPLGSLHWHSDAEARIFHEAVRHQLEAALDELQSQQNGGRFPTATVARDLFARESVARHFSGPINPKGFWYNPAQPALGSDAEIIAGENGGHCVIIRANREVDTISKDALDRAGFVSLTLNAAN